MGCNASQPVGPDTFQTVLPAPSPLESWVAGRRLQLSQLECHCVIGVGTFGRVSVAHFKEGPTNVPVALKVLNKSTIVRLRQVEHVNTEKTILKGISHPFIVNLVATFQDKPNLYMLMEYVNGGELHSYIQVQAGQVEDRVAQFFAGELFLALEYLHSLGIAHRDVKPSNILITSDGHTKLTDFGFAKVISHRSYTFCGTAEYISPEIVRKDPSEGHSLSVDWWAFGIVLFEILMGFTPFIAEDIAEIMENILAGSVDYPRNMPPQAKGLVAGVLAPSVDRRMGPLKIRKHKFFNGLRFDQLLGQKVPPPFTPDVSGPDDTRMFEHYADQAARTSCITDEQQTGFNRFSQTGDSACPNIYVKQRMYPEEHSHSFMGRLVSPAMTMSFKSWGGSMSSASTLSLSLSSASTGGSLASEA